MLRVALDISRHVFFQPSQNDLLLLWAQGLSANDFAHCIKFLEICGKARMLSERFVTGVNRERQRPLTDPVPRRAKQLGQTHF